MGFMSRPIMCTERGTSTPARPTTVFKPKPSPDLGADDAGEENVRIVRIELL
jgi:hypothetical protein